MYRAHHFFWPWQTRKLRLRISSIALKLSPCVWGSQVQTSPTYVAKTIAQETPRFLLFYQKSDHCDSVLDVILYFNLTVLV